MPRLDVIMPIFNGSSTVEASVRSTLRALPRDSRILLYDDASTDDTLEKLSRLSDDPRVVVMTGSANVGSGVARQRLLDAGDSHLVACMDADDICMPWRFRRQMSLATTSDIVFGSAFRFRAGRRHFSISNPLPLNCGESRVALLIHNPFVQSSMLARRSVVAFHGYRNLRTAQDYDLWLRIASSGAVMHKDPWPAVGYRFHASQVSAGADYNQRVKNSPELKDSWERLFHTVSESNQASSAALTALVSQMRVTSRYYYRRIVRLYGSVMMPEAPWRSPF
jgi:glycosyltransferase involved in cell wall biosynthesis